MPFQKYVLILSLQKVHRKTTQNIPNTHKLSPHFFKSTPFLSHYQLLIAYLHIFTHNYLAISTLTIPSPIPLRSLSDPSLIPLWFFATSSLSIRYPFDTSLIPPYYLLTFSPTSSPPYHHLIGIFHTPPTLFRRNYEIEWLTTMPYSPRWQYRCAILWIIDGA